MRHPFDGFRQNTDCTKKNNQKECRAVNGTKIALKAKVQLANFMGKVFTHFSKPTRRFIEECIYGIQASGDTKLSSIVRTIDDDINPIYTEKDSAAISTTTSSACF